MNSLMSHRSGPEEVDDCDWPERRAAVVEERVAAEVGSTLAEVAAVAPLLAEACAARRRDAPHEPPSARPAKAIPAATPTDHSGSIGAAAGLP